MKLIIESICIGFLSILALNTANTQINRIHENVPRNMAESHLRFLASDEMRGRNTGTIELNIAGRYIAEQFRKVGLIPLGDHDNDYLQTVPLHTTRRPSTATLKVLNQDYEYGSDLAIISGKDGMTRAPMILVEDPDNIDADKVKGKIVVIVLRDLMAAFRNQDRVDVLKEAEAIGLVEIFTKGQQYPWPVVMQSINRQRMSIGEIKEDDQSFYHVWVRDSTNQIVQQIKGGNEMEGTIMVYGLAKIPVHAFNVVGMIKGTDPELQEEHLIMCAHYDHVGVQDNDTQDSIYNGTRDNGIGTTGIINAAHYFSKHPPKRSIIFIALTGEEKGLLGSRYYADHPKIPLEKTVFTLNIDNSGYTDTESITLLDTNRTNIDALVYQAASEVGLKVMGDRIPSQNYYERSDQVSFATKGVPAVNFKMSMEAFDERISTYYHQPSDQVDNVDLDYIYKYWITYIRSAELIGNWNQKPYWIPGDKFEAAGKELYGLDE